ncbi:MAG: cytochrome P450 [Actinobacteria bacterium]|nr:cytochrome P450 [Actinomycetota bacterium]
MRDPGELGAPGPAPPALQSDELEDPYPHLAAARRHGAVTTTWPLPVATGAPELGPIYSVLGYDESVEVLRDHETYSSRGLSEAMGPLFTGAIIAMDEPEHRLHRALVAPAFRPKVLERWQTTVVQPAIDQVMDTFADRDRVDLVEHLTFAFPVRVIARILGLPEQDVADFQRWSLDLINMFNDPEPGARALEEFRSYFMALITERRRAPRDDLISDLIQSEVEGHRLDDDAIFASVKMLLPAGVETTYRSLGNLLVGLLTHTDQLRALRHDRALIGPAIEEGLRWQTPFLMVARQTTRETEVAGIHIPADQHVFVFVAAANHDERRYPDPEAFNISRTATTHIAFGTGPHICLGMHLTRVESRAALERILDRAPTIRLDPDEPEPRIRGTVLRSPDAVNVQLR